MKINELNNLVSLISKYFLEDKKIVKNALFITLVEKIQTEMKNYKEEFRSKLPEIY